MFDIGFFELLLVLALGLVVVGPKRLPGLVRQLVARWRRLRGWVNDFQNDVEQQLDVPGLEQDLHNNAVMRKIDKAKQTGADLEKELREQLDEPPQEQQQELREQLDEPPQEQQQELREQLDEPPQEQQQELREQLDEPPQEQQPSPADRNPDKNQEPR